MFDFLDFKEFIFCIFTIVVIIAWVIWFIKNKKQEVIIESHNCEDCPFHYEYFEKEKHDYSFKCNLMDRSLRFDDLENMLDNCPVGGKKEILIKEIK